MTNPWKKASEAFRTRRQAIKQKIHQSKPIQWLLKQGWKSGAQNRRTTEQREGQHSET